MLPDRVSNPGPLTYESGALPIALCCPAPIHQKKIAKIIPVVCGFYRVFFQINGASFVFFTMQSFFHDEI